MFGEFIYTKDMSAEDRDRLPEKAAQGDADAQYRWGGELQIDGNAECVGWWKKAAKQGHASALNDMGVLYMRGEFVRKDEKYGVELLRRSANQECSSALRNLFYCYKDGLGVKRSKSKALECLQRSAQMGSISAMFDLAWCYERGFGVPVNEQEAMSLYLQAAQSGDASAMFAYALQCLEPSDMEKKDVSAGLDWLKKAASAGDYQAMYEFARVYALGLHGIPRDKVVAAHWAHRACMFDPMTADDPEEGVRSFNAALCMEYEDMCEEGDESLLY